MIYITCKTKVFWGYFAALSISTPNVNIVSLYTAILLTDVLTASDMRMREKLRHKGNPKNLLYWKIRIILNGTVNCNPTKRVDIMIQFFSGLKQFKIT